MTELIGARLKLERARHHLDELAKEIAAYVATEPFRTTLELEPETGHRVLRLQARDGKADVPPRLALIAGDAAHNLRASLDHAVYQLAGPDAGITTQFPIVERLKVYPKAESEMLRGVPDAARRVIESVQPFHVAEVLARGEFLRPRDPLLANAALMLVGRLDNKDKHRVLLAGAGLARWKQPDFRGVKSAKGTYPGHWVALSDGAELYRITDIEMLPGQKRVDIMTAPVWTITFGGTDVDVSSLWADRTQGSATKADLAIAADHIERLIGRLEAALDEESRPGD